MPDPLPSSASSSFDLDGAQVVVEWVGVNSELRYLYQSAPDLSRQVTFDLRFDPTSKAAFFKIRAPVGLKAAGNAKTPLYLYIHPHRITSLAYDVPVGVPDIVKGKLGPNPSRLHFILAQPVDLVVPSLSLAPQNKGHGEMLDSMKLLAQASEFSVYLPHANLTEALVQPLCSSLATRSLKSIDAAADLRGLYGGKGGKVLEGADLCIPMPNTAPPSYDKVDPAPPQAQIMPDSAAKPAGSSRKRRRGSASSATGKSEQDVTAACKKMIEDMMSQHRQEERAYFSSQMDQLRASLSEDLRRLKSDILEHLDQRLSDLQDTLCIADEVDEQITQHVSSFEDLIDVRIEDRVTDIKIELEDFVDNEVANAEDRVLRRVRDASWTVAIDE